MKSSFSGLALVLGLLLAGAGGCGARSLACIRADHPKAKDHFLYDVEVYYAGDEVPEGTEVIEHIQETASHTDCETAAVMAIVKMQKEARSSGGNALVDLKPVIKDEKGKQGEGKGFSCTRRGSLEEGSGDVTLKVGEVTWEGDIASLGGDVGEEPLEDNAGLEGLPEEEGGEEAGGEPWMAKEKKGKKKQAKKTKKKGKKGKKAKGNAGPGPGKADMVIDPSETGDSELQLDTGEDIY
jgi:hypothetical protein